jgi:uncharacterized protein with von Willebrand factor type A (vWA) domain
MSSEAERRWRLALGRYANTQLGGLSGKDGETDRVLDYLYAREYQKRGVQFGKGPGSLDPTQMNALNWLGQARQLFPNSVFETLQAHALDRYGITDLLKDPKTFDGLEPNPALLKTLLSFDGRAQPQVKEKLRAISREIIEEIMRRLKMKVERAFSGRRDRFRSSHLKSAANFDWRRTVRENLKTWDPEKQRLMVEQLRFNARQRRRLPWKIILCIDQSGSMTDSLIHSAVMAAILSGLPGITVKMVLFDTSIIDVSEKLTDPLETLLSVQLGGGTDIGRAVQYCETLVTEPARTVFVLVTDFCEGASPRALYAAIARLAEARVRLLGLTALDESGVSEFDPNVAHRCADLGMHVAAMTPDRLADWLAGIVQ